MAKRKTKKGTGKRTRIKRSLKTSEFVQYRDRKGRVRKPRSDLLLFAEVRDRKTKKLKGYLNKFEKGKVIPRKFARKQRAVQETPILERFRRIEQPDSTLHFSIKSSSMVMDQIPRDFYNRVMDKVRSGDKFLVEMDMTLNDGSYVTMGSIYFANVWSYDLFVTEITKVILDGVNSLAIRISPKKVEKKSGHKVRRPGRRLTRVMHIRVQFTNV